MARQRIAPPHEREKLGIQPDRLKQVKARDLLIRFGFGLLIAIIAATVGVVFGPKAGGLFLAFPAILPASLTLIEKKEGKEKAAADAEGAIAGAFGLAAFALVVLTTMKSLGPALALPVALLAWLAVSLAVFFACRAVGLMR